MTIGTESFGNGVAKTDDRFTGQLSSYRQGGRRDSAAALNNDHDTDTLGSRNGSGLDRMSTPLDAAPIASSLATPTLADSALRGLNGYPESNFSRDPWLDSVSGSLADHPLLRGLLLELPPKGTIPQQEWLDRWFEAARSILELLYSQEARS